MKTPMRSKLGWVALIFVAMIGLGTVMSYWNAHDFAQVLRQEFDSAAVSKAAAPRITAIQNASDLKTVEQTIADSEERVQQVLAARGATIRPGQRKTIYWVKPGSWVKTPLSLVYVHGFSGGPLELEPTVSELSKRLGANLFSTRLTAHGISDGEDFATVRARDWAVDVAEAVEVGRRIGERVVIVAVSTGAPIAIWHLRNFSNDHVAALVLLSPNYGVTAPGAFALRSRWSDSLARVVLGSHRNFDVIVNELHGSRWTTRYRSEGVAAMMRAVAVTADDPTPFTGLPVLTLYTKHDTVVSVSRILEFTPIFHHQNSKLIDWRLGKSHQLASAAFYPELVADLVEELAAWIQVATKP